MRSRLGRVKGFCQSRSRHEAVAFIGRSGQVFGKNVHGARKFGGGSRKNAVGLDHGVQSLSPTHGLLRKRRGAADKLHAVMHTVQREVSVRIRFECKRNAPSPREVGLSDLLKDFGSFLQILEKECRTQAH